MLCFLSIEMVRWAKFMAKWYMSQKIVAHNIRYSSCASLQLNAHTRTCLGKFVIKLACSLRAVRVHLVHTSAFIVCESWTSAFNARERCTSAFNARECCTIACECSHRTWQSCWSSSLLPFLKTTTLSLIGGCFKLVHTHQIFNWGHVKTVIGDEPCYICMCFPVNQSYITEMCRDSYM